MIYCEIRDMIPYYNVFATLQNHSKLIYTHNVLKTCQVDLGGGGSAQLVDRLSSAYPFYLFKFSGICRLYKSYYRCEDS